MKFLADIAHKRSWMIVAVWVVLIISVSCAAKVVGSSFTSSRELPDTESSKVQEILSKEFPSQRGDSIQLVIE